MERISRQERAMNAASRALRRQDLTLAGRCTEALAILEVALAEEIL